MRKLLMLLTVLCTNIVGGVNYEFESWDGLFEDLCVRNPDAGVRVNATDALRLGMVHRARNAEKLIETLDRISSGLRNKLYKASEHMSYINKLSNLEVKLSENKELQEIITEFNTLEKEQQMFDNEYQKLIPILRHIKLTANNIQHIVEPVHIPTGGSPTLGSTVGSGAVETTGEPDTVKPGVKSTGEPGVEYVTGGSGGVSDPLLNHSELNKMKYSNTEKDEEDEEEEESEESEEKEDEEKKSGHGLVCGREKLSVLLSGLNEKITEFNSIFEPNSVEKWEGIVYELEQLNKKLTNFIDFCLSHYESLEHELKSKQTYADLSEKLKQLSDQMDKNYINGVFTQGTEGISEGIGEGTDGISEGIREGTEGIGEGTKGTKGTEGVGVTEGTEGTVGDEECEDVLREVGAVERVKNLKSNGFLGVKVEILLLVTFLTYFL
ncbi:hypothetical protein TpMuguga_03g00040 [Theileria parva strain Muguga]|uniref:Uncharacterized protein n=1 Tax=Theileria parva TaxID=5875 RepID=Q4MZA7_THEPA|nr:uncharacterized protein TpMuguga_03g00040 [Theileria parva strain Muguga]EAN30776.1 hypothetical protein TpMuguga_03g00040 [Theileria parva strain Muguga]|eukprot:XP_763059.1 hypothetical protein [Theileria parva strain Muguga]